MFFFAEVHHQLSFVEVLFDGKSNVINWFLLVIAIGYGWMKLVPPMFEARQKRIRESIASAQHDRDEAKSFLTQQENRIANAEKESARIVEEARVVAAQMKADIEAQTEAEINRLHEKLESALLNERQMLINELRSKAAKAAIHLSRSYLETSITEADKKRLLSQFMQQLETVGSEKSFAPGTDKVESRR